MALYTEYKKNAQPIKSNITLESMSELTDMDPLNASMSESGISVDGDDVISTRYNIISARDNDNSSILFPDSNHTDLIDDSALFPDNSHVDFRDDNNVVYHNNCYTASINDILFPDESFVEYNNDGSRLETLSFTDVESQYPCPDNIVLSTDNTTEHKRIYDMISMRVKLADNHLLDQPCVREITFDDKYTNAYSKGLVHDKSGFVKFDEFNKLIYALNTHDVKAFPCKNLINPSAAWSADIIGKCNNSYRYSKIPNLGADMIQLYCMSLCRDVPFDNYHSSSIIKDCCSYLGCDVSTIFKGPICKGTYISNLLGNVYKSKERVDYLTIWDEAIAVQNGTDIKSNLRTDYGPIITGRDLACFVHNNDPIDIFSDVANMLLGMKVPLKYKSNEESYINFGKADIQSTLYITGRNALLAAWYVKWNNLVPRPEAYGIEVERVYRTHRNKYGVTPCLLNNKVLRRVRELNGTALLSQVYREGAPLSPSMVSGYATVAGACATVLKFFFDYDVDEINKLAFNVALGRCWAGVNYYTDAISGLKRGEQVAISCLQELIHRYPYSVIININRFDGKIITINNDYKLIQ